MGESIASFPFQSSRYSPFWFLVLGGLSQVNREAGLAVGSVAAEIPQRRLFRGLPRGELGHEEAAGLHHVPRGERGQYGGIPLLDPELVRRVGKRHVERRALERLQPRICIGAYETATRIGGKRRHVGAQKGEVTRREFHERTLRRAARQRLEPDAAHPREEVEEVKPHPMAYSDNKIHYRHYGRALEDLIAAVAQMPEGEEKNILSQQIAHTMKRQYLQWNRDSVDDQLIVGVRV